MAVELTGGSTAPLTKRKSLGIARRKRFLSKVTDEHQVQLSFHNHRACTDSPSTSQDISSTHTLETGKNNIDGVNIPKRTRPMVSCKPELERSDQRQRSAICKTTATMPTATNRQRARFHRGMHRKQAEFKLPLGVEVGVHAANNVDIDEDIAGTSLEEDSLKLEQEINALKNEGLNEAELQAHMKKMHEYNELKDMGQMLLGKIAVIEGVTTKDLYNTYGLDLKD